MQLPEQKQKENKTKKKWLVLQHKIFHIYDSVVKGEFEQEIPI